MKQIERVVLSGSVYVCARKRVGVISRVDSLSLSIFNEGRGKLVSVNRELKMISPTHETPLLQLCLKLHSPPSCV